MAKEPIKLENLRGGEYLRAIDEAILRAAAHAVDRPDLVKSRVVTAKITITPKLEAQDGGKAAINMPLIDFQVDVKIPGTKGIQSRGIVRADPETGEMILYVDPVNPEQAFQPLFEDTPEDGKVAGEIPISAEENSG